MILGLDLTNTSYSPVVDFKQAFMQGVRFVILRGSEAYSYDDKIEYWAEKTKGIIPIRGITHKLKWNESIKRQIFLNILVWCKYDIELPPIIICQDVLGYPGKDKARLMLKDAIEIVHYKRGQYPIIKTSYGWWTRFGSEDEYFLNCPLWLEFRWRNLLKIPKPWSDWVFGHHKDAYSGRLLGFPFKKVNVVFYQWGWNDLVNLCAGRAENPAMSDSALLEHLRKVLF